MSTQKLNVFEGFGTALKEALVREGRSAAWLSRKTGKDKAQISKYINGNIQPREITQRELTAPLSVDIVKSREGEWRIIPGVSPEEGQVQDSSNQYGTGVYKEQKRKLQELFNRIQDAEKLFNELDKNSKLNEAQKRMQVEMIRQKLTAILKSELGS